MFSPYYDIARKLRFRISRLRLKQSPRLFHSLILKSFWIVFTLSNISVEIWTVFASKSWISLIGNRTNIRYWNVTGNSFNRITNTLSSKRFYRPIFRSHLTNKESLEKLLSYSQDLRDHYELYQLLLFHFQEKHADYFFELITESISSVNPIFQTIFRTFLRDQDKIINALELPYQTQNLRPQITSSKSLSEMLLASGTLKILKREFSLLEYQKERTNLVLSRL